MDKQLEEIIRNVIKDDSIEINENSEIADDLGFTSLSFFELIFEIEVVYGIKFADRKLKDMETVSDIQEAIQKQKEKELSDGKK